MEFSVALSFRMESGPGDWGSLTKALRAERAPPPLLLQHVACYRDFINTLARLMLINELSVKDSVLNTSEKSVLSSS